MNISTKLWINTGLSVGLVILTGTVLFASSRYVAGIAEQGRAANTIVKEVFELTMVADEYLMNRAERAQRQWNLKHDSLGRLLQGIQFSEPGEQAILMRVRGEHQGIKATFAEVVENQAKRAGNQLKQIDLGQQLAKAAAEKKTAARMPATEGLRAEIERVSKETALLRELDARLAGQMLAKSQAIVSGGLQLSNSSQDKAARAERQAVVTIMGFVLTLGLAIAGTTLVINRSVVRPIAQVQEGAEIVARGNLDHRLQLDANDEIGEMSRTFDRMLDNLKATTASRDELDHMNTALKNSTAALIQSEKLASIGQMVAGVAHEMNTPLAYVSSSVELVKDQLPEVEALIAEYVKLTELLNSGADEQMLGKQFEQVQVLSTAFRENRPLDEAGALLARSIHGLNQIRELVMNLKNYSRTDRERMMEFNLNEGLDSVLMLAKPVLKTRVKVVKDYGDIPFVACSPSQINQVFLNLVTNAAQAIEGDTGTIQIQTRALADRVQIVVRDNGKGIPPEAMPKIFEPFFTTKKVGEGTGLGLSISRKIVEEHGGTIQAESVVGKGTVVTVSLPAQAIVVQRKRA
jgi:signal transduction histidine kinase